ncbi:hypothetical protein A3K34_02040 [candidate division WWE3 bacterium RIFOXYC1_FULL_40_10]|uniref:VOC domain-containing protein n=1 Tax=candidate division WWE3 bacterium RIFOXYA2_FULL_46_9 TaxID=1802636 RepID=A0A1F4VZQ0_UNCKA|nr:MAG: hypothetical protein A3K58_02040 [candidate division WWE3 bacterium RIFOXYB1_FULL_40_22]OGC61636.1 MAG: hypothetical protein A3K37_02040 [candidate division WWE3 bacterium RIFOXYA1_FULL_40_11]OGC62659.1 MAG: hypothetical protein A2264_02175 [candidate division WWE3 bacterium RIFOXYA2_FULL_46_9]OGC64687.1 MAG: hypothetical protein A2326_01405 [candidate division WWE3 bacterium RIFOXYB2_FULL_41_6]OGC66019.1 MAG: hypothetical protein A3K34_02040 [candidate division WWE3 bacterium RIFOXYC1_
MSFEITGIHHIEFTVTDLEQSKRFYSKFPGFKVVAEYPNFVMFQANEFYLGLTDHKGCVTNDKFSEFNVGLDHLAFGVSSLEDLREVASFLDSQKIPHSEINVLSNGTHIFTFRDPDNIQLEFAYKPGIF